MLTYEQIAWAAALFIVTVALTGVVVTGNLVVGVGVLAAPIPIQIVRLYDLEEVTPGHERRQRTADAGVSADLDRLLQPGRPAELTDPEPELFLPDCPPLERAPATPPTA